MKSNPYQIIRNARLSQKVTQGALAAHVGCKQSAISMLEQGRGTAVNSETLQNILDFLHVKLPVAEESQADNLSVFTPVIKNKSFCPNAMCPSNVPMMIGTAQLVFVPRGEQSGEYCKWCGELLEKKCPNCGEAVHSGAFCGSCGTAYVPDVLELTPDSAYTYVKERREELMQMDELTKNR